MSGTLFQDKGGNWVVSIVRTTPSGDRIVEHKVVMDVHEVHSNITRAPAIAKARAIELGLIKRDRKKSRKSAK